MLLGSLVSYFQWSCCLPLLSFLALESPPFPMTTNDATRPGSAGTKCKHASWTVIGSNGCCLSRFHFASTSSLTDFFHTWCRSTHFVRQRTKQSTLPSLATRHLFICNSELRHKTFPAFAVTSTRAATVDVNAQTSFVCSFVCSFLRLQQRNVHSLCSNCGRSFVVALQ